MASRDIDHHADNSFPKISAVVKAPIGDKAHNEQKALKKGMSAAGSSEDMESHQLKITKSTLSVYRQTVYWGYGLMTFVIIVTGFFPDFFYVDIWVQVIIVASVISNNIAGILGKLFKNTGILNTTGMG